MFKVHSGIHENCTVFVVKYWLEQNQFPVTEISGVGKLKIKPEGNGIIVTIPVTSFSN